MRAVLLFFIIGFKFVYAQSIVVNPTNAQESNLQAQELLEEVWIDGGECFTISNFQMVDDPFEPFPSENRSWGYFEKANSNFPFERGIIMTTGYVKASEGPSDDIMHNGDYFWGDELVGDPDALYLINLPGTVDWVVPSKNITIFEFDFTPYTDEISFNYIFGSEEYHQPGWACYYYNDVFAFLLSGPGISNDPGLTGKNIALTPDGDYITAHDVNGYWCGDDTYYVNGPFQDIQFPGRTIPLTAHSQVIPGETYHIKLMISDGGDTWADSSIFLEAGSFDLSFNLVDENQVEIGDEIALCNEDSYTLFVENQSSNAEIKWYLNDNLINEGSTNLTITESGIYKVEVSIAGCTQTDTVNIILEESPLLQDKTDQVCAIGSYMFDLTYYNSQIIDSPENYHFSYYLNQQDAIDNNTSNQLTNPTNFIVNQSTTVYVRVETQNGCFDVATLTLTLNQQHKLIPANIMLCDDPYEPNDGVALFDLTSMEDDINNGFGGENYTINYFASLENAMSNQGIINNPTEYLNIQNPQKIYARLMNEDGTCEGTAEFMIEVLPVLEFELPEKLVFCGPEERIFTQPDSFASYRWTDETGNVISQTQEIEFPHEGNYTLEVTASQNSCVAIREVEVIFESNPVIDEIWVDGSTVTVQTTGEGPFQYSYNNGLTWHDDFILSDIPSGIYKMLVLSLHGCLSPYKSFAVLGIPNFISPNGDGYNDTFTIRAIEMFPDATIKIVDRYGKVFVERKLDTDFQWDGTYMGRTVPSGDYWYIISIGSGEQIIGHVSVRTY